MQNSNLWLMGPCVLCCLSTPLIMAIIWLNYDYLVGDSWLQWVSCPFMMAFIIGGSIDASHELIHRPELAFKVIGVGNLFFYQFMAYPL